MESLTISRNSSHVTTKKFLEPLDLNTLTPRRKRSADLDTMNHPKSKRARNEKGVDEELSKARPTKAAKRGQSKAALNETPSQRLDVYVFGSGESGELGLGHLKRNGKPPTNVKRPRLNDLLDAKTVGVVQLDVGGMRKSQFPEPLPCSHEIRPTWAWDRSFPVAYPRATISEDFWTWGSFKSSVSEFGQTMNVTRGVCK
jgi:alpha-tubulin suppressor-like RCC1 family protein